MKRTLIVVSLFGAGVAALPVLAQETAATGGIAGMPVYALKKVEERQLVGTIRQADQNAFRVQIGDKCVGLPRADFTEADGQFESPWPKEALEKSIADGNPEDFVCPEVVAATDPATGSQVFARKVVTQKEPVGTIKQADANAVRLQIGEQCVGLPRDSFTMKDGALESPWTREQLEKTISEGDPADFVCPA
jgi:hypothetical protein